ERQGHADHERQAYRLPAGRLCQPLRRQPDDPADPEGSPVYPEHDLQDHASRPPDLATVPGLLFGIRRAQIESIVLVLVGIAAARAAALPSTSLFIPQTMRAGGAAQSGAMARRPARLEPSS